MVKIGMLLPEADMVPMAEKVVKDMNVGDVKKLD